MERLPTVRLPYSQEIPRRQVSDQHLVFPGKLAWCACGAHVRALLSPERAFYGYRLWIDLDGLWKCALQELNYAGIF